MFRKRAVIAIESHGVWSSSLPVLCFSLALIIPSLCGTKQRLGENDHREISTAHILILITIDLMKYRATTITIKRLNTSGQVYDTISHSLWGYVPSV